MKKINKILILMLFSIVMAASTIWGNSPENSVFDQEFHKVKYNYAYASLTADDAGWDFDEPITDEAALLKDPGRKSPGKAFLLSLAVPGLGQYYYGSKVKAAAFLGIEATAWILHLNWHNKGEELTDEFEQFNHVHWSQSSYEDYLQYAYGVRDDDSVPDPEVSHNLPDTKTQQFYEMTGKYNQFSWGWDDAELNGLGHANFDSTAVPPFPPAITGPSSTPTSENRFVYETMRNDANNKLDDASKMVMVALANHVLSAVEAYISVKSLNNKVKRVGEFSNWKIKPSLKSYNHRRDTPYVKVTYKF